MPPSPLTASVMRKEFSRVLVGLIGRASSAKAVGWNCTDLRNSTATKFDQEQPKVRIRVIHVLKRREWYTHRLSQRIVHLEDTGEY